MIEDDGATSSRRHAAPVGDGLKERVTVRLHEVDPKGALRLLAERTYRAGTMVKRRGAKAELALRLIDETAKKAPTVVGGATYGGNRDFLDGLRDRGYAFICEARPSELVSLRADERDLIGRQRLERILESSDWRTVAVLSPITQKPVRFLAAFIPGVAPHFRFKGVMFAARTAGIDGITRGTIFAFASEQAQLPLLVEAVLWARWIRPALRRDQRKGSIAAVRARPAAAALTTRLTVRANIALADRQDDRRDEAGRKIPVTTSRHVLGDGRSLLNVIELFAGAGGMGLGFLLAGRERRHRLLFSGEVNPIYATTLRNNHRWLAEKAQASDRVPETAEPVDLRNSAAFSNIAKLAKHSGGVDILIGGPPCQGFSNANRNSWSRDNPNNKLVGVFVKYVETLRPPVFVMENVQGILWTSDSHGNCRVSVVDNVARKLKRAGYRVYPRLLDAVWYGAPQYRSRFFLVGIHRDLGYTDDDFGEWGPFPSPTHGPTLALPYVTVRDALSDLPPIGNGDGGNLREYTEPSANDLARDSYLSFVRAGAEHGIIHDHVTSRHADYVIDRYRRIPPGGNWESIVETMSNYADVQRTHSNIYRRLSWDRPAITIGHYRKSMLVHPEQHRGLSLREAARLQSFPDWFRFAGRADEKEGGLVHKQQQLANAVCPLVSKALAEFLLRL